MKSRLCPAPEPLESRVAPAVFFLDATTKNVVDAAGDSVNNAAAQTLADSDIAVLLAKGDSLVLDLDGDHVKDAGEPTLVSVTGGKAMVFARDVDADGGFDLGELTGIAASHAFKATLGTDIRGPIATTLLDDGTVGDLAELGTRSIAGITSTGVAYGIFAGGAISNVSLGTGVSAQDASAGSIGAGTGGAGFTISYAGNGTSFVTAHTPAVGVAGPSIKNLTLPSGFTAIYAGDGGAAAAGGPLSRVLLTTNGDIDDKISVKAGDSGESHNTAGVGGASLSRVVVTNNGFVGTGVYIYAGKPVAPTGAGNLSGGNAGALSDVTWNNFGGADTAGASFINTYGGAPGLGTGKGGNGGSLARVTINSIGEHGHIGIGDFQGGGAGGAGGGNGGNGGAVSNITGIARELRIDTGRGGDATAGSGGNAGKISNINVTAVDLVRRIVGGRGGYGTTVAGFGGSISGVTVIGDIGDFGSAFGWDFATGMGGISPGIGGNLVAVTDTAKTGSVTNVTATRIAAIVAGAPANNAIVAANAVTKITGLTTAMLGADMNGDGLFDFTDAGAAGFNPGDADTAIDGLVLVKTGGFAVLPVQPLKLVFV